MSTVRSLTVTCLIYHVQALGTHHGYGGVRGRDVGSCVGVWESSEGEHSSLKEKWNTELIARVRHQPSQSLTTAPRCQGRRVKCLTPLVPLPVTREGLAFPLAQPRGEGREKVVIVFYV